MISEHMVLMVSWRDNEEENHVLFIMTLRLRPLSLTHNRPPSVNNPPSLILVIGILNADKWTI